MSGKHKSRAKPFPELPELTEETYSVASFAAALRVKLGTVKRWKHEGKPASDVNGVVVIHPSEALGWVRQHARPSSFAKSCLVYFAAKGSLIKIGSSIDPTDRLRKMHVNILATVPGDKRVELAFHELFAESSVGEEWFKATPELLGLIDSLKAA
jgi:hypothetical protein